MVPLDHLIRLTDDWGIWQHARHSVPDRRHGYCLDDAARALWLCARRVRLDASDPTPGRLAAIYASFVDHAWQADAGRFLNFMTHDRHWIGEEDEDATSRTLLALAETARAPLPDGIADWARDLVRETMPLAGRLSSPRAWAWALGALAAAEDMDMPSQRLGATLATRLLSRWRQAARPDWPFFEDALAYDSPRLAQGALDGARWEPALAEAGLAALGLLAKAQTGSGGCFRPPGAERYGRPGPLACFPQQPLDAWAQIEAALAAHRLTGEARWHDEARRAHAWFLGENDVGAALVTATGGCRDGIDRQGLSVNQGAESTLAWLHSDAAMHLSLLHR